MSNYDDRRLSLAGIDLAAHTVDELRALVGRILDARMHGICFSPFVEGQGPGDRIDEDQLRCRLEIIAPHFRWIRTFSCSDGHELIPGIAAEFGLRTMVGVWLDDDRSRNRLELNAAIDIANAGHADILAVGNEVMLRGELTAEELAAYIERAKSAVNNVPVGYVDAYFIFSDHPQITAACDVILANCYPFWEGCAAEYALPYMKDMYRQACKAADDKKVIISETGWPTMGSSTGAAVPSERSAMKYFIDTWQWTEQDDVEVFYFSAFDETWKVDKEGDVGASWGLWQADGRSKFA